MTFVLQKGYSGIETSCVRIEDPDNSRMGDLKDTPSKNEEEIPVGSVEFCEAFYGRDFQPDYHPKWLEHLYKERRGERVYRLSQRTFKEFPFWVKPADRFKRFDAHRINTAREQVVFEELTAGPFFITRHIEDIVAEYRIYASWGQFGELSSTAYYYTGENNGEKVDGYHPCLPFMRSCAYAIDIAVTGSGVEHLVECHLPYACGWYGGYGNAKEYLNWLKDANKFMRSLCG